MERLGISKRVLAGLLFLSLSPWVWSAEGLQAKIESVLINGDLKPEVTFTLQDNAGAPVAVGTTAGDASVRFIIARLDVVDAAKGSSYYWSYNVRIASATEGSPNFGAKAEQATYDTYAAERVTQLAPGKYVYVFNTALPADYDRAKTHTVCAQIERTVDGVRYVANPIYHFVPNGSPVVSLRKVSTTESCNKCHTNLGLHGGARMDVTLCLLCHSPQSTDPESGNTVDMTTMIHKIHRGAELPSVRAGKPYVIYGNRGSLHDYSHVVFPTDNRNCTMCHTGEQGDVYKTAPSRRACGSCHDNINFQTGEGHMGIPQADDNLCALCHKPEGAEFDFSISGAHTIPAKSKQLKGIVANVLQVSNAQPGQAPVVRYTLKQNDGSIIDPATMRTVAITVGGPRREYTYYLREDGTKTSVKDGDAYVYTFTKPLPADAQGTYSFTIEARRDVVLVDKPEGETDIAVTESAFNPIFLVAVTGNQVVQRRQIVDQNKCLACHDTLSFHGGQRNNVDYCVVCHNPKVSDIARRPEGVGGGESISMGYMIHKIHKGHELSNGYTVYGFGNVAHDYSHVIFPGDQRACSSCHITAMPSLPLNPEVAAIDFVNKEGKQVLIPPATANCMSCHDSPEAVDHASKYNQGMETCFACHGAGQFMDIAKFHKLDRVLNVIETTASGGTIIPEWSLHN